MKLKIGGGDHLQAYDEDTGQYTDEYKAEILEKDMENLTLVHLFGMDYGHLRFHFPKKGIHDDEYCEMFVEYLRCNNLLREPSIPDAKLDRYLFKHQEEDDKSKFMIEILGFENNAEGWELARKRICDSLDFKTAKFAPPFKGHLKIKIFGNIIDSNGKIHSIVTIWAIDENMGLTFVTLYPGKEMKNDRNV